MMRNKYTTYIILGIGLFVYSSYSTAQDIESDLVLDMSFSNEITDLSGFSAPVSSLGIETFVEDRFGNPSCAIEFTGVHGEHILIPTNFDNQIINGGEEFTVSLWFRMKEAGHGGGILFQKDSLYTDFHMSISEFNTPVASDETNRFYGSTVDYWDDDWYGDISLHNDTVNWHHFALVVKDSAAVIYRDNAIHPAISFLPLYDGDFHTGDTPVDFFIGRHFSSFLDDVKMYKRALMADEIAMLYELDGNCESLAFEQEEIEEPTFTINNGILTIENMNPGRKTIHIYNTMGQTFPTGNSIEEQNATINLTEYSTGIYIIHVRNDDNVKPTSKKILIP